MQNRRTPCQDQMVLTNHNFVVKKLSESGGEAKKRRAGEEPQYTNTIGLSQLLLIVNNWQFVRDTQHDSRVRACTLSDFQVQLKLSSSAFRSQTNPDTEFPFDKQSANFPYDSFVQLMKSNPLKAFEAEVRELYEETQGPVNSDPDTDEAPEDDREREREEEEEEEEEDRPLVVVPSIHRVSKRGGKK